MALLKTLTKYRISVENESRLTDVASVRVTIPGIVVVACALLILSLVASGLIIAFTPLRTLLPGYMKESQRAATEEGLMRLDSLMAVYEQKQAYIDNFLRIADVDRTPGDSAAVVPTSRELTSDSLMQAGNLEKRFVSQMAEREKFNISVLAPLAADGVMFSPVSSDGIFTKESQNQNEGVVILAGDGNVQSGADGSVIALYYSPSERGYVIVVQHARGFATSYSHVGSPLVGVGDEVASGQMIALGPAPDSKGVRKFMVRMWHNGHPIVPYEYLERRTDSNTIKAPGYEAPRGKI